MNNHGSWAEPGDLVRYISPNGTPTDVVGVVLEIRLDDRSVFERGGAKRKMLRVARLTAAAPPRWAIASYFSIIARSESLEGLS
jgi:hypothetical protein